MRRGWDIRLMGRLFALPLVLWALVIQLGAPMEAARMAAAMADPFATVIICSPDRTTSTAPDGRQDPARHANHDCGLCAVCAATAGPLVVAAIVVPYPAGTAAVRPPRAAEAQPRGPPLGRPNARGPPKLA